MVTIAVDWTGAVKTAGKLAFAEVIDGEFQSVRPFDSREQVASELIRRCRETSDTIIGLDFAFSMPEWFFAECGISSAFDLWQLAENKGEAWLQDCSPPFWGRKVMDRHRSELEQPASSVDALQKLEGTIWCPRHEMLEGVCRLCGLAGN